MLAGLAALVNLSTLIYGAVAVVAFWLAIRLGARLRGIAWYGVVLRVVGTVALLAFGVMMLFYAAFGAGLSVPVPR